MEKDVLVDIRHSHFQKAFDKVERLRRGTKLSWHKKKGQLKDKEFLKDRKQSKNKEFSQWRIICGSLKRPGLKIELLNTFSNSPEKEINNEMIVFAKINVEVIKWFAGIISQTA